MNWIIRLYDWIVGLFDRSPQTAPDPEYVWRPAAPEPSPVGVPDAAFPHENQNIMDIVVGAAGGGQA